MGSSQRTWDADNPTGEILTAARGDRLLAVELRQVRLRTLSKLLADAGRRSIPLDPHGNLRRFWTRPGNGRNITNRMTLFYQFKRRPGEPVLCAQLAS
jgi:hypothetical protein